MADYNDHSNDRLEKLLAEYKKDNNVNKLTELAEELRKSQVHLPCKADENNRIAAMIIRMKDGKSFIPIYTSKWHLNGKMQSGQRVAVIPYNEVNKIAANEARINKLDGIILNPQDTNIVLNMNFVTKMLTAQEEQERTGQPVALDFSKAPNETDNTKIEEKMSMFAAEADTKARQQILNDILNLLRTSTVALPLGVNVQGKNAPLVMTNNATGDKFVPVYTDPKFAAKRHEGCKVAIFPFDQANGIALGMSKAGEIGGMSIISEKVTVNLKTKLLENVKEVNDKLRNNSGTGAAQSGSAKIEPAKAEQIKFTMITMPGLLEKRGKKFIESLIERKAAYVDELYENAYFDIRQYPYVEEEFTVTAITADATHDVICIEYPAKDGSAGSAVRAYIVWDNENDQGRYFGLCKNADDALMIVEVSEGKQTVHGISAIESNEVSRIMSICGL